MGGGIFILLIAIAIIAYSLYIRRHPESAWRMNEGWKVDGESEPSEAYLEARKFSGAVGVWIGAFFIIVGILLIWQAT
ncbi:DUF6199 family natural product biosynthesis protein [Paenibacillus tepidiphilus]|uniref:DUF6199 family natural product biosynthesis protein n=1 Tax=Paenibacillus tepidiphilus TaxID=2608683 RepID=UPI0012391D78|nr:DUF6199 family natural product biosynthesis protein [Paenibacillus tepidiphilus]